MSRNLTFDTRDEFNRKQAAENIIKLLENNADVTPMLIQGGWGSGKTEFTHKLMNEIGSSELNFQIIYFDAFAADRVDNPLLSLIAQMQHVLQTTDANRSLKEAAAPLIKLTYTIAHFLGVNVVQIMNDAQRVGNTAIENMIDDHAAAEVTLQAFKNRLAEYSNNNPMIIFIDELDRCRPDYALNLIETIKHVFDVPNVWFVVVANVDQLTSSISHCYGIQKPREYLDKFFKFTLRLSDSVLNQAEAYILNAEKHFDEEYRKNAALLNLDIDTLAMIRLLIKRDHLSLRQIETLIRYLVIYRTLGHEIASDHSLVGMQRVLGVYIYLFHPALAQSILNQTYSATQIVHLFTDLDVDQIRGYYGKSKADAPDVILKMLMYVRLASPEYIHPNEFENLYQIIYSRTPIRPLASLTNIIAPAIRRIMLNN